MKIYSTLFLAFLLFTCTRSVIELQSIKSITSSLYNLARSYYSSNTYRVYFNGNLPAVPNVAAALCQFQSPINYNYAMNLSIQSIDTYGCTLKIKITSDWNYLSYNILGSIVDSVLTGIFYFEDLGLNQNKTAVIKNQSLNSPLKSSDQISFKLDIFIMGLNITIQNDTSDFFINATINYGVADIANSDYSKYNDYIYTITDNNYPSGMAISTSSISLSLNWFGNLTSLQLTYISHPVVVSVFTKYPLTTGYNTAPASQKANITLFDPRNNKNNLATAYPVSFYGFTSIDLKPVTTINAIISLSNNFSYFAYYTSYGSKINSLSSSYFFYEPLQTSIVDYKFNQVISSIFTEAVIGKSIASNPILNQYYKYQVSSTNSVNKMSELFVVKEGHKYMMTIQILDQQGCYTGSEFVTDTFTIGFTKYDSYKTSITNAAPYFVNPNQPCTSSSKTQFQIPVQNMFRYFQTQIIATKTQYIQGFFSLSDQANTFFLKNIKFFELSPNAMIDPNITEVTINAFQYYYTITPTSQTNFAYQIPTTTFSNALIMNVWNGKPVTLTSNPLTYTPGKSYTLNFFLLDSAGNLTNQFKSPILLIKFEGITYKTIKATLKNPFCSTNFNSTVPLTTLIDQFYLQIDLKIIAQLSSPTSLQFILSDSSALSHMYAIRGISVKYIEYFDPYLRSNVQQCLNIFVTNTLPHSCQSCYIQNKIYNGSQCACPSNTFQNSFAICIQCHYSCYNCLSVNKCTSCPAERTFDANLFMCNCTTTGFYDDGVNTACAKCYQSCGSCSKNAYNCTSCPIGSVLDTTTSACICGAGYFNDTTTRCGKCSNKCGNCSENANKCTSCLNESGSTFDSATSTCKCQNGYSFSTSGICMKVQPVYLPNFHTQQLDNTFKLKVKLTPINNSSVNVTDTWNSSSCTLYQDQSPNSTNITLNIIRIELLPNNLVQFSVQNPPFDVFNTKIVININNSNINQTSIEFSISQLYSSQTMSSNQTSISSIAILLTILLQFMLVFYVLGYKHNHTIGFIQKVSLLRFNIPITFFTFSFLYNLKYSYYAYGNNPLQNLLPQTYQQNSNDNFYFFDKDANILRNVGIPILLSIATILFRLIGICLFKSQQTIVLKKYYYRTIEYIQRTIMFPIMFFSIAEIIFASFYGMATTTNPFIQHSSFALSVFYLIYFTILVTVTCFSQEISNYAKLEFVGEFVFSVVDAIIIIQTQNSNKVLTLVITIVMKCVYEIYLKHLFATIMKFDLMRVLVAATQIALIVILSITNTSLVILQVLFIIVVAIDVLYVFGTTILKAMNKSKRRDDGRNIEIFESNKAIVYHD